jgi:hypothetical protein
MLAFLFVHSFYLLPSPEIVSFTLNNLTPLLLQFLTIHKQYSVFLSSMFVLHFPSFIKVAFLNSIY